MREVTRQLERVRRVGRLLLFVQRVAQWVSALLVVMLACGVVDYALRLPAWLRLFIGIVIALIALAWLISRLSAVLGFRPELYVVALRAERLYPQLAGVLASGVELAKHPPDSAGSLAGALARAAVDGAQRRIDGLSLHRLINPRRTLRKLLIAAAVLLAFGGAVSASSDASRIAASRWFVPLGGAQWPRRTQLRSLVRGDAWPAATPLRLRASVEKGYHSGMRTWVVYRLVGLGEEENQWRSLLMSEQAEAQSHADAPIASSQRTDRRGSAGVFERLIDLAEGYSQSPSQQPPGVEFYFMAGDDRTELQKLRLVTRPSVESVKIGIEPPRYARGLIAVQDIGSDQEQGPAMTAAALVGSTVDFHVTFNKPISVSGDGWDGFLPGLTRYPTATAVFPEESDPAGGATGVLKTFVLDQAVQTPIHMMDEYGLSNLSERLYRIEAIADGLPAVSMVEPVSDETVLPSAVIELEAVAQDDVGVETLALEGSIIKKAEDREQEEVAATGPTAVSTVLAEVSGRRSRLAVRHPYDLRSFGVSPGDEAVLTAVARDVYDLNGSRHEPVRSSPRRLRVIDTAAFVAQIRSELAGVRQRAIRMKDRQQRLLDQPAAGAYPNQQQLGNRLEGQAAHVAALAGRMKRNRLDPDEAGQLYQTVDRARELIEHAGQRSLEALHRLDLAQSRPTDAAGHRSAAREDQRRVGDALDELISLLNQGRDALALRLQLQQLKAIQEALAEETRRFMPVTLGWSVDQLSKPEQQKLKDLADRQAGVSKLSGTLVQQMQTTADVLSRQGESPDDQAAAQVLAEAASIARRQGLTRTLQQAAEKAQQNRLSDAGNDQASALDLMEQMLGELSHAQQRRQAILQRRLIQLAEAIRKLIGQQHAQLDVLEEAIELVGLDAPMTALRRNTIATAERAHSTAQFPEIGDMLDEAARQQSDAVSALRRPQREPAIAAEQQALEHLQRALEAVEQLRRQAQVNETDKQRREFRQAYMELAQQQETLRKETDRASRIEPPSRRRRAALYNLGHRQADLQAAAKQLQSRTGKAMVFTYLHGQIDQAGSEVVARLRKAQADADVLAQQDKIASALLRMADALERDPQEQQFADQPGGSGGGGGSGSQAVQLVPPVAELKLLRGMQQQVYRDTRAVDQQPPPEETHRRDQIIRQLSDEQRQLGALGTRLIQQMRRTQQTGPSVREVD